MSKIALDSLRPDDNYFGHLGNNIWLMDNHKWAFYVWMKHYSGSRFSKFSLVHLDYHWDGLNDFDGCSEIQERLFRSDLDEIFIMVRDEVGIKYDSFIVPAILWGILDDVHYFCRQTDSDEGVDPGVLVAMGAKQLIHTETSSLVGHGYSYPIIFDLCVDLFNDSDMYYEGIIWPDSKIENLIGSVIT